MDTSQECGSVLPAWMSIKLPDLTTLSMGLTNKRDKKLIKLYHAGTIYKKTNNNFTMYAVVCNYLSVDSDSAIQTVLSTCRLTRVSRALIAAIIQTP